MFNNYDKNNVVTIALRGNENDTRSLSFYYDQGEPTLLKNLTPMGTKGRHSAGYVLGSFEWKDASGKPFKNTHQSTEWDATAAAHGAPGSLSRSCVPTGSKPVPNRTKRKMVFLTLVRSGVKRDLYLSSRNSFLKVENTLSVEVEIGNVSIWALFPWMKQKMPIYLALDGLNKIATILLHIAHCEKTGIIY